MSRDISVLFQPRCLLIFVAAFVLIYFVSSFSRVAGLHFPSLIIRKNYMPYNIWCEVGYKVVIFKEEDKVEEIYETTHRVFLDVDIDKQRIGRIIIGLYGHVMPKTVENFRALCTGEMGTAANGKVLHYRGTPFHRIIPGFMIQGGDIVSGDGRGNQSIYGGTFRDESYKLKHSHAGTVSMVNSGPDSNGSQFFITTVKAYWLDGEHVVFGKVIEGMDTVYAIEGGAGTYSGKPRKKVIITDSGEIPKNKWDEDTRTSSKRL